MTPAATATEPPSSTLTRVAVGISIAVHVAAVALSLGYAGAGLFQAQDEAVPVSLVTPEQVSSTLATSAEDKPQPDSSKLDLRLSTANSTPQQQADPEASKSNTAKAQPELKQQQTAAPPAPPQPATQSTYKPPQPDISTKYQVDLGLKLLANVTPPADKPSGGKADFDDVAMDKAKVDTSSVATFRAHLKQCAALPAQIATDDKVVIVLRATFTPDGKLAATPTLIEASASAKGPALMQAAIQALQTCQPHSTLPADKYAEWRVLDLRFTPQDFRKG